MPSEKSKSKSKAEPPREPAATPLPLVSQHQPPTTASIPLPFPIQAAITTTTRIEFVPVFQTSTTINYDQYQPKALPPTAEMCLTRRPSVLSSASTIPPAQTDPSPSKPAPKHPRPAPEAKVKAQQRTSVKVPESKPPKAEGQKQGDAPAAFTWPLPKGFMVESERVKLGQGKSWHTGPKIDPNWRENVRKTKH